METNKEDFILKQLRHYQGTVEDYATFWERKISQGYSEESEETKSLKQKNDDLNRSYRIIPVSKD